MKNTGGDVHIQFTNGKKDLGITAPYTWQQCDVTGKKANKILDYEQEFGSKKKFQSM